MDNFLVSGFEYFNGQVVAVLYHIHAANPTEGEAPAGVLKGSKTFAVNRNSALHEGAPPRRTGGQDDGGGAGGGC
ncbi:hypothetical protein D9619_003852 [Psilocybe cf. subviscida]|uniref:Uncharacterized protein n=1 Tax=Psilocybe cf. subviscida TaxID=2480587 RepID=A0A8H5EUQ0_9AGAR|nr:hypothetical protein D9619_003852 [Psilocybe cf. subviscida]